MVPADIVTPEVRSRIMSAIRGKDTKPELMVRSALHRAGYRFRIHRKDLPGRPDLVFPRHGAVLFVHGCFWHGHNCHLFRWPATRKAFWKTKIGENQARDERHRVALLDAGWRVATIWGCALDGKNRLLLDEIVSAGAAWLESDAKRLEIKGSE